MHVQTPVWAALAVAAGLWAGAAQAQPVPRSGPAPSGGSSSSSSSATTPEAALACVAARYQGEALAVQWLGRERLWEVRWLTPARAVLRIKLAPGCQFDEVHGVGQEAALKPPGVPMKLLVVEDDAELSAQVAATLEQAGFVVDRAHDGTQGEFLGSTERYAAVVLDLGLPGLGGVEVLQRWRSAGHNQPVLILTARDAWGDKVAAFKAGADDYLTKPFRLEELVLRLQVLIRRAAGHAGGEVRAGPLALDTATGVITLNGLALKLTAFESRLLRLLLLHKGRTVSRTDMVEQMYDGDADRDFRSLEVVMGRLRRKLGEGRIETVRGEGYRLLDQEAA